MGAGYIRCVGGHMTGYLRTTFDTKGAHLVHPQVTDVHRLTGDLDRAALEVLLLVHMQLEKEYRNVSRWGQGVHIWTDRQIRTHTSAQLN